jgi:heme exporter protein A
MTDPQTPCFTGHDLACVRGGRVVFAGLDFSLSPGDGLVLLGPNGSGKSSLLRVMAGLLRPAAGRLAWHGETVAEDPEAHAGRSHYVGHHDAVKPVLSVAENLRFWARLHEPHAATAGLAVENALERFGLGHLRDIPGKMLSAGQKRRTALACLVARRAELWLLDEPHAGLDATGRDDLDATLREAAAAGATIIVASHEHERAGSLASRSVDVVGGRVLVGGAV